MLSAIKFDAADLNIENKLGNIHPPGGTILIK